MATLVSAPLPDLELATTCSITVDTGDPAAIITRIIVHLSAEIPEGAIEEQPVTVILAHEPAVPAGLTGPVG